MFCAELERGLVAAEGDDADAISALASATRHGTRGRRP